MRDQTAQLKTIKERLEKLEKQNRRLRRAGLFAFVAASALLLMGQTAPKRRTVEAERFVLRDSKGKVRGELSMGRNGPSLDLYDAEGDGKVGASLTVEGSSPTLFLHGPSGSAMLGSSPVSMGLVLLDTKGNPRVDIDSRMNGTPAFRLYDPEGKEEALTLNPGSIILSTHGQSQASMSVGGLRPKHHAH